MKFVKTIRYMVFILVLALFANSSALAVSGIALHNEAKELEQIFGGKVGICSAPEKKSVSIDEYADLLKQISDSGKHVKYLKSEHDDVVLVFSNALLVTGCYNYLYINLGHYDQDNLAFSLPESRAPPTLIYVA